MRCYYCGILHADSSDKPSSHPHCPCGAEMEAYFARLEVAFKLFSDKERRTFVALYTNSGAIADAVWHEFIDQFGKPQLDWHQVQRWYGTPLPDELSFVWRK